LPKQKPRHAVGRRADAPARSGGSLLPVAALTCPARRPSNASPVQSPAPFLSGVGASRCTQPHAHGRATSILGQDRPNAQAPRAFGFPGAQTSVGTGGEGRGGRRRRPAPRPRGPAPPASKPTPSASARQTNRTPTLISPSTSIPGSPSRKSLRCAPTRSPQDGTRVQGSNASWDGMIPGGWECGVWVQLEECEFVAESVHAERAALPLRERWPDVGVALRGTAPLISGTIGAPRLPQIEEKPLLACPSRL